MTDNSELEDMLQKMAKEADIDIELKKKGAKVFVTQKGAGKDSPYMEVATRKGEAKSVSIYGKTKDGKDAISHHRKIKTSRDMKKVEDTMKSFSRYAKKGTPYDKMDRFVEQNSLKENKAMSTPEQIFESIRNKNLVETQNTVASLLEQKIDSLKEYKKMEVAAKLFNMPTLQENVAGESQQTVTDLKNPSLNDLKKLAGQVASAARLEGSQNTEDETFTKVLNAKVKEIGESQGTPAKVQQQAANKIKQAVRDHDLMPGKSS